MLPDQTTPPPQGRENFHLVYKSRVNVRFEKEDLSQKRNIFTFPKMNKSKNVVQSLMVILKVHVHCRVRQDYPKNVKEWSINPQQFLPSPQFKVGFVPELTNT